MPKKIIRKPVEPPIQVRLPDSLPNRVDVTAGAGVTVGGVGLSTPPGLDGLPANFSNNSEISKDAKAANPTGQASLSPVSVSAHVDAKNLARLGEGFIDAGAQIGYRPGTNASSTSVVVRGDYRRPVGVTPFGAFSLFGGGRIGAEIVSGATFNSQTGQGTDISGTAAQLAVAGGVEVLFRDRFPIRLGVVGQVSTGALNGSALLFTIEAGGSVIENGKAAWKTTNKEAGLPQPLTEFEQLKDFALTPKTVSEYNARLSALAEQVGKNSNLSSDESAKALGLIEQLWLRTTAPKIASATPSPYQFFISDIGKHLHKKAAEDQRLLGQLANIYDKALKGAESLPAQTNCQAKLDVLTTFYAPIFGKRVLKDIQTQHRSRADSLLKELVKAAEDGDTKTPGLLAGILKVIPKALKGTDLLKANKAVLKEAAKKIAEVDIQKEVLEQIDTLTV